MTAHMQRELAAAVCRPLTFERGWCMTGRQMLLTTMGESCLPSSHEVETYGRAQLDGVVTAYNSYIESKSYS